MNAQQLSLILGTIGVVGSGLAIFLIMQLNKLRKSFFAGKKAADLEEFIMKQSSKLNELHAELNFVERNVKELQDKQKFAIQKLGVVRYNPFQDDGGNLSFSMAILDDYNNGVVITSLHGREANRTYAKPIKNGASDFGLTKEEEQSIQIAENF